MHRVAVSKDNLKPYFHRYQLGIVTQVKVAEELGISKQYVSRVFSEFKDALDNVIRDNRGRPCNARSGLDATKEIKSANAGNTAENTETEPIRILKLQIFLLQTLVEFLLLWIGNFNQQLGINHSPFNSRLSAEIKLFLLKSLFKYQEMGGKISEFALGVRRDTSTFYRWINLYSTGQSLDDKPSGPKKQSRVYQAWVLRAINKLKRKYPLASPTGLARIFNSSITNPGLKLSVQEIKRILSSIEEERQIDKTRRKKRYDFTRVNVSWDLDFMEFTINGIRRKAVIIVDHYSRKLLYARIMIDPTAKKVANIVESLTRHYQAVPLFIKADNGPEFRKQFKLLMSSLNINLLNSPRYYPQFNGVVERVNREIRRKSRAFDLESTKAVNQFLEIFLDHHNYNNHETLSNLHPNQVYANSLEINHPDTTEIVIPYQKDGELRIKFTDRKGNQSKRSLPLSYNLDDESTCFLGKNVCKVS